MPRKYVAPVSPRILFAGRETCGRIEGSFKSHHWIFLLLLDNIHIPATNIVISETSIVADIYNIIITYIYIMIYKYILYIVYIIYNHNPHKTSHSLGSAKTSDHRPRHHLDVSLSQAVQVGTDAHGATRDVRQGEGVLDREKP